MRFVWMLWLYSFPREHPVYTICTLLAVLVCVSHPGNKTKKKQRWTHMLTIFFVCLFFFSHLCFNMTLESIFFLSILCLHTHTPVVFWLFSPFYSQELFCYFCFEVYQFSRSCYFLKFFSSSQNWKEKIICIDLMIFWTQNRSVLPQDAIFRSSIMTKRLERLCIVWKKKITSE